MDTSLTPVTLIKLSYSFAFILNRGTTKTSLSKNASACVKIHIYYINTRRLLRTCRQQRINVCKAVTFVNSNGAYFVCQYFIIFVIEMWHLNIKILESSNKIFCRNCHNAPCPWNPTKIDSLETLERLAIFVFYWW